MLRSRTRISCGVFLSVLVSALWATPRQESVRFQGERIERFLAEATITDMESSLESVTRPRKATLELDQTTHSAVFKDIDVFRPGVTTLGAGTVEVDFQDSWRTEVAAYELDKLIGLGMVPATISRVYRRKRGSMQWWVDSMMTEYERASQGRPAPDGEAWNRQLYKVRLFDNLIHNVDRHMDNMLITEDWQVYLIDHSRTFRRRTELRTPDDLKRFSRSLLLAIELLDEDILREKLGAYLTGIQIQAMLERRDKILALTKERIQQEGQERTLYP